MRFIIKYRLLSGGMSVKKLSFILTLAVMGNSQSLWAAQKQYSFKRSEQKSSIFHKNSARSWHAQSPQVRRSVAGVVGRSPAL